MLSRYRSQQYYHLGKQKNDPSVIDELKQIQASKQPVTLKQDLHSTTILRCKRGSIKDLVPAVVTYPGGSEVTFDVGASDEIMRVRGSFSRVDIDARWHFTSHSCKNMFGPSKKLILGHAENNFVSQDVGVTFVQVEKRNAATS